MPQVVIMLGSNSGDRKAMLDRGVDALRRLIDVNVISGDVDFPDYSRSGNDFLNRVVCGNCTLTSGELRSSLRRIENALGRDRNNPAVVAIDIDTVIYDGEVLKPDEYDSLPYRQLVRQLAKNSGEDVGD